MDLTWLLLLVGGAGAGFINAIAGGGSVLTLPILMLSGLDASVANGTNRLAVALQGATASGAFYAQGVRLKRDILPFVQWAVAGAIIGSVVAVRIPPMGQEGVFGFIFIAFAVILMVNPNLLKPSSGLLESTSGWSKPVLFLVGLYGGLFQAGVGVPLLVALVGLCGLDVIRASAVKVLIILIYSMFVLLVFSDAGMVDWTAGGLLGLGGVIGSLVGARVVVSHSLNLIRGFLICALLMAGVRSLWVVFG